MSKSQTLKTRFQNANIKELGIFGAWILLVIVFSILSPYFFSVENFLNILRQISLTGIMAIGMTMVIATGEIDLSVSANYGLAAIIAGMCVVNNFPIILGVIIGLLVGLVIGAINGVLNTYVRIPSIIVTLGMMNVARGTSLLVTKGIPVIVSERMTDNPNLDSFLFLGQGKLFGVIPFMALFLIIVGIIGYLIFNKTILGFRMRAVGGSVNAAKASGINVQFVKIMAFTITGILSAFAGILNISFITNVRADSGTGLELITIASVIIGGTSISGGEGTILGTIIGVLIIGTLRNGLVLVGISPFWQTLVIGIVIIGAVTMDIWFRRGKK